MPNLFPLIAASAVALGVSLLAIALLIRLAPRYGLLDKPSGRKQHAGPVPVVGGLALAVALSVAMPLAMPATAPFLPLMIALWSIVLLGFFDDYRDLSSVGKLLGQLVVATLAVAWGGQTIGWVGTLPGGGELHLGNWAVPITLFAIVGLINAINMMDGLDGLAGGVSLAMLSWLVPIAAVTGGTQVPVLVAICAALAGFLIFNARHPWRARAAAFLGDAGSMALGLLLAWFVIELADDPRRTISPVAFLWVLALPVQDTLSLALRRTLRGRSPFSADREHLHHIFLRAGFSVGETSFALSMITWSLGAVGVLGSLAGVPDVVLLFGLLLVGSLHYLFIRHAWRTVRALRRLHNTKAATPPSSWASRESRQVGSPRGRASQRIALLGLYLSLFCLPWFLLGSALGLVTVVLATLLTPIRFWHDIRKSQLSWVLVAITAYLFVRAPEGLASFAPGTGWSNLAMATGVLALPVGWWLARLQAHWLTLLWTLLCGGAVALSTQMNWPAFEQLLSTGEPIPISQAPVAGALSAFVVLALLGASMSAITRIRVGWRPWALLGTSVAALIPATSVLIATGYSTAWLGVLAGLGVLFIGGAMLPWRMRSAVGLFVVVGIVSMGVGAGLKLTGTSTSEIAHDITGPVLATALHAGGAAELAAEIHPTTTRRMTAWRNALERLSHSPWIGSGRLEAAASEGLAHVPFYAAVLGGTGIVGLALYGLLASLCIREVIGCARHHAWPRLQAVTVLALLASIGVMFLLSVQLTTLSMRLTLALLIALCVAAGIHHRWAQAG